ncbi:MFS transporter, partial [Myxococcota bacterium]|nr:MFS transporter [Myxococcota bacterium]
LTNMHFPSEKKTFLLSLVIYFLIGTAFGVFTSADVIAARTLGAGPLAITALMFLLNGSAIFSLPLTQWLGTGDRRRRSLLVMGVVCTAPVFLYPLVPGVTTFIFGIFVVHLLNTVLPPTMNILYRRHFRPDQLGRLFGWTTSAKILAGMGGSIGTGLLLDHDETLYLPLLVAAGVLTLLAMLLLSRMDFGSGDAPDAAPPRPFWRLVAQTTRTVGEVLSRDRTFLRFERNFIIYGLGFLLLTPVVPVYFVRVLDLDYSTISLSRMVVGQTALWMLSPMAGAVFDRSDPFHFTGFSYLTLAGYPLLVGLAALLPDAWILVAVLAGYAFYSVGMTGVSISWHIGSIRFARDADPSLYQGVHVTLTGLRSLFGPILGYVVMTWFGFAAAFGLATVFFTVAGVLMLRERRA